MSIATNILLTDSAVAFATMVGSTTWVRAESISDKIDDATAGTPVMNGKTPDSPAVSREVMTD